MMETIKDLMYAGVVFASLWMFMAVLCQRIERRSFQTDVFRALAASLVYSQNADTAEAKRRARH